MSAAEIIEQLKTLPRQERQTVLQFLSQELATDSSLYEEFSLLGADSEASDVEFATAAQTDIVARERT